MEKKHLQHVYIRTVKTVKTKDPKGHKKIQFTQFSVNIIFKHRNLYRYLCLKTVFLQTGFHF